MVTFITGVIFFALTIFAFRVVVSSGLQNNISFKTKIDFTMCRGVMMVVLLVFSLARLAIIFLPVERCVVIEDLNHVTLLNHSKSCDRRFYLSYSFYGS